MCGIFGSVGIAHSPRLTESAHTMDHRGPDGFGEWFDQAGDAYMAHCRLAIVDLSADGAQPMSNEDGTLQLVYNGEIYNHLELRRELEALGHRFQSRTDSEVLLHGFEQWGDQLLPRLRGMFAFGIWDVRRRRWFLARDRIGVKPLLYAVRGRALVFASEARALIHAMPQLRQIEPAAALQLLRRSYVAGTSTIWKGVWRLPPGCMADFDAATGGLNVRRYWSAEIGREHAISMSEAEARFEDLVGSAVGEELMGDVPVGVFLSGGLDSSLIASYAKERQRDLLSFFVDFRGWPGSERDDAGLVAGALGTTHRVPEIPEQIAALSNTAERHAFFSSFDEPVGDPSGYPTWLLCREVSRSVKVALSGDGGDEIFGGYRWYAQMAPNPRRQIAWRVESWRRRVGHGREWPRGCESALEYYHLLHCPSFSDAELALLFPHWQAAIAAPWMVDRPVADLRMPKRDEQLGWQLRDLTTYLVDNNLARVDSASMAHGLEVRVPLLDHRVVDFGLSLPAKLRCALAGGKPLMRRVADRRLPAQIAGKRKQGFSMPMERLIDSAAVERELAQGALVRHGLLSVAGLMQWLNSPRESNHALKLWLLYALEGWAGYWCFDGAAAGYGDRPAVAPEVVI